MNIEQWKGFLQDLKDLWEELGNAYAEMRSLVEQLLILFGVAVNLGARIGAILCRMLPVLWRISDKLQTFRLEWAPPSKRI